MYVKAPKPEVIVQPNSPIYVQPATPTVYVREPRPQTVTVREQAPHVIRERVEVQ